ncbi:MAG: PhoH family protein [Erysipelotrichaceae bacterium]|nr:PhoH family protein [Erysipelotrichaceae bacterium]
MDFQVYKLNDISHDELKELLGVDDSNLKLLCELYETEINIRDNEVKFFNTDEKLFSLFIKQLDHLVLLIKAKSNIDKNLIKQSFISLSSNYDISWQNDIAGYTSSGKPIKYKTSNQYKLSKAVNHNDLVFSIGPAGTGKTYLAVLLACNAYKKENVKKIILTRPAVEAGESLGFLPGDLKEKVDPYLMPLYDALYEILGEEKVTLMLEKNQIEIIPLAYMRGRTLNDSFVILDEAQNTTPGQMLMFLTRLGNNSKMIVNGDLTQIDLNISKTKSGLSLANEKLRNINGIEFVEFNSGDIVRNPLVEKIIEKYKV